MVSTNIKGDSLAVRGLHCFNSCEAIAFSHCRRRTLKSVCMHLLYRLVSVLVVVLEYSLQWRHGLADR